MDNDHAQALTDSINGLSAVLGSFVGADAITMVFTAGMLAWVTGWGVGIGLKMLSKLS